MSKAVAYCESLDLTTISRGQVVSLSGTLQDMYGCTIVDTNLTQLEFSDVRHIFAKLKYSTPIGEYEVLWEKTR